MISCLPLSLGGFFGCISESSVKYHIISITMERTQRVAFSFTADNDDEALKKAAELNRTSTPADFEGGDEEHDYALCDGAGNLLVDWD